MKIALRGHLASIRIQQALFKLGYSWKIRYGSEPLVKPSFIFNQAKYFYVCGRLGNITYENVTHYFQNDKRQEIYLDSETLRFLKNDLPVPKFTQL